MTEYKIITTVGEIEFNGKYRRDLETNHWHYYEKDDGTICHFRKEHMVAVFGDNAESITADKSMNGLLSAATKTLNDNLHLCDGDVCTLKDLRDAVAKIRPDWCQTPRAD